MASPQTVDKAVHYQAARAQIAELVRDLSDPIAAMASAAAVLYANLSWASWVGFYRVASPELLRIGPYQGSVGCLEIDFARGVCGAAARRQTTIVVPDVHEFPGHIACDPRSRSEIVVPVFDLQDRLVAVLDIDSHQPAAFDQEDRLELERITSLLSPCFDAGLAD